MATKIDEPTTAIDDLHAAAIGRVAVEWAKFELALGAYLHLLTWMNVDAGACVTAQIPYHQKLAAIAALFELYGAHKTLLNKWNALAQQTHGLADKRNRIIHDPWIKGAKSGRHYRLQITAKNHPVFEHKIEDAPAILQTAEKIRDHCKKLDALWEETMKSTDVLLSWREKFPPLWQRVQKDRAFPKKGNDENKPPRQSRS